MLGFINFLQPIIALMFIIAGSSILLFTWGGWMMAGRISYDGWKACAINHGTAVVLCLTGFFIANWN